MERLHEKYDGKAQQHIAQECTRAQTGSRVILRRTEDRFPTESQILQQAPVSDRVVRYSKLSTQKRTAYETIFQDQDAFGVAAKSQGTS